MKLIDEKGKIFGVLNIVDILIVILILAVIAVFTLYATNFKLLSKKDSVPAEILYTVELKEYTLEPLLALKEGDKLYDINDGYAGTILSVSNIEPCKKIDEDAQNGKYVETVIPERYDVQVTIKGEGAESDMAFEVGDFVVNVGRKARLKAKTYYLEGFIIKLDAEKEVKQ